MVEDRLTYVSEFKAKLREMALRIKELKHTVEDGVEKTATKAARQATVSGIGIKSPRMGLADIQPLKIEGGDQ